jgi:hypothetical protein
MSVEEQQEVKQKAYAEAIRYMDNAKEVLRKAHKEDNRYQDKKYVRMACGTAYSSVLLAMDAYLQLKDVELPKKRRRSIEWYTASVAKQDGKLLTDLDTAYDVLHLAGYYDGILRADVIKAGFDTAYDIIERIMPRKINAI